MMEEFSEIATEVRERVDGTEWEYTTVTGDWFKLTSENDELYVGYDLHAKVFILDEEAVDKSGLQYDFTTQSEDEILRKVEQRVPVLTS